MRRIRTLLRSPKLTRGATPVGITVVLALGLATQLSILPPVSAATILVLPFAAGALAFFFAQRATSAVVFLIGVTMLGLYRGSTSLGPIDIRAPDIAYVVLVAWAIRLRRRDPDRRLSDIGQRQLGVLLAILGLSLLPSIMQHPDQVLTSAISWIRIAQTLSLVLILPYVLGKSEDHRTLLNAVGFFGTLEILRAIFTAVVLEGGIGDRLRGANGPNATGLIAGILLVLAAHSPTPSRRSYRLVMAATGIAGLALTRSNGAITATAATFAIYGIASRATGIGSRRRALAGPFRVLLMGSALLLTILSLRPGNLPGSQQFSQTSSAHRLVLATAGIDIFVHNPIVGVGWQRSQTPEVIGAPELSDRLRQRFSRDTSERFFPDQSSTNVHNAYIQLLAESGIAGFATLVSLFIIGGGRIRRIVRQAQRHPWLGPWAAVYPPLLVLILVWWNDNGLFGVQPETVLAAVFLSALRGIGTSLWAERNETAKALTADAA